MSFATQFFTQWIPDFKPEPNQQRDPDSAGESTLLWIVGGGLAITLGVVVIVACLRDRRNANRNDPENLTAGLDGNVAQPLIEEGDSEVFVGEGAPEDSAKNAKVVPLVVIGRPNGPS